MVVMTVCTRTPRTWSPSIAPAMSGASSGVVPRAGRGYQTSKTVPAATVARPIPQAGEVSMVPSLPCLTVAQP